MTALSTGVSSRGDNYDSVADRFLGGLVDDALRTRNVIITAERDIQHADVVAFAILDYPMNTLRDLVLCYSTAFTRFHQYELRILGQTAIHTIAELSVAGSDNRRLRAVPLPRLD